MDEKQEPRNIREQSIMFRIIDRLARIEEKVDAFKEASQSQHEEQKLALQHLSEKVLGDGPNTHETRISKIENDESSAKNKLAGGLAVLTIVWSMLWAEIKDRVFGHH